ncbi:hypothetical protein HKX48_005531 [Thoreauomyces humboldtii]|nr:hypothetical protein HKX48_005531 [Thoreauomyces humboldtii]
MTHARALFDCDGDTPQELSFKAGDSITDVRPAPDAGWLVGTLGSKTGLFPGNYVMLVDAAEAEKPKPPSRPPPMQSRNTISASTSASSISSLAHRAATTQPSSGMRRDLSAGSLHSESGSDAGFRAALRPAPKPADFNTPPPEEDGADGAADQEDSGQSVTTSDAIARAKKKLNAHATRMAIQDKSNALAKAGRESLMAARNSTASNSSVTTSDAGRAESTTPPWARRTPPVQPQAQQIKGMTRSASGSSVASDHASTVAALRNRFNSVSLDDAPPVLPQQQLGGSNPALPNRPGLLVSNQSYAPPKLPSRATAPDQPASGAPPAVRSRNTTPVNSTPILTAVPSIPTPKPIDQPPSQSQPLQTPASGGPSLPARRPAPPRPTNPPGAGAGAALGLPIAADLTRTVVNPNPASSLPAPPVPSRPRPAAPPPPPSRRPAQAPPPPQRQPQERRQSLIPKDAQSRYMDLFVERGDSGLVGGEDARKLWVKSGLDNRTLGLIW